MTKSKLGIRSAEYANPASRYLATLSQGPSRVTTASALRNIVRMMNVDATIYEFKWHEVTIERWLALRDHVDAQLSPSTVNRYLAAIRGVLKAAWRMKLMDTDAYTRASDLPDVRHHSKTRRRYLSQSELRLLYDAAGRGLSKFMRARDKAILAVMYGSGVRRAELIRLDMTDVRHEDDGTVRLRIQGKGRKERDVWISETVRPVLQAYIEVRGVWRGPLFPSQRQKCRRMHPDALTCRIKALGRRARIGLVTPHDLRGTCFSTLFAEGVDIILVKNLAGHSNVATTARYDLRDEGAVRAAVGKLPIPFAEG